MNTVEQFDGVDLPKSTIFCTCKEKYHRIKKEFDCELDSINKVMLEDEFLKEEDMEEILYPSIYQSLHQSEICYVIIDLGQERDLKIAKYIYEAAKKKDILTIGIGVKPSLSQNEEYREIGESQISLLKNNLDSLVIIDNEVLLNNENITLDDIEKQSNDNVIITLKSMIYPISLAGLVNIDVEEFKIFMDGNTIFYPGFGYGSGENRAEIAAEQAINNKFLVEPLKKATKQLLMIEGDPSMDLLEIYEVTKKISEAADCDANIIFGAVLNESLKNEIKVSIIAGGYELEK